MSWKFAGEFMKKISINVRDCFFVVGPILIALYPIFFLWNVNANEISNINDILVPSLSVAVLAIVLFFAQLFLFKDAAKSSFVSSIIMLLFMNFRYILEITQNVIPKVKYWHIMLVVIYLIAGLSYLMSKIKKGTINLASGIISLLFAVLLLINLVPAVFTTMKISSESNRLKNVEVEQGVQNVANTRNVYWLLMDEYASNDNMEKYYGYDNSQFTRDLEELGFNVSYSSKNRFKLTAYVLVDLLHLDRVVTEEFFNNEEPYKSLLDNNKLIPLIKQHGYEAVPLTLSTQYNYGVGDRASKPTATTVEGYSVTDLIFSKTAIYPFIIADNSIAVSRILGDFDTLKNLTPTKNESQFYLWHTSAPHVPFLFDANGELTEPHNQFNVDDPQYYLGYYQFVTDQMYSNVSKIVKEDPTAIIAVLSDHSIRIGASTTKDVPLEDSVKVFTALYVGGEKREIEGYDIVNLMRTIVNETFGLDYEMLPQLP